MEKSQETKAHSRLIPLVRWNDYHDFPTIGGLRHLAFLRNTNGFNGVVRYIGRRIYIDEQAFFRWVEKQNGQFKE